MMCHKCEEHVRKALEALPEVEEAVPDHETGKAVLRLNTDIADRKLKEAVQEAGYEMEEKGMKQTIKIQGMMCTKCEAHVKKALEALPEVNEAVPSHEADEAVLDLNSEVSADVLKKAVEEAGYEYIG